MYNIDINLLKDRPEYQSATVKSGGSESKARVTNYSKTPIFVGLGVGLLALLATGGGWLYLDNQGKELQAKQTELDKQLGAAKTQEAKLAEVTGKITQSEQESKSLANVFNMVRPWSAILREFQESVPKGMQIRTIAQIAVTPPPASPSATPTSKVLGAAAPPSVDSSGKVTKPGASPSASASPQASASTPAPSGAQASATPSASPGPVAFDAPVTRIQIDGVAQSFNEVNSFILTLKQSPFFNPDDTQLIDSSLVEQSVQVTAGSQASPGTPATSTTKSIVTKSVKYTIQTSLKQVPAAELLRELESKGAIGLVTRLKSLQQQQVIKP
jgi:type IV pilus assembly protein PilN